jgi:hypothetical protein
MCEATIMEAIFYAEMNYLKIMVIIKIIDDIMID